MTTELSNTPETDNLARGNHVVPTDWAEQLERERDEARGDLDNMQEQRDLALRVIKRLERERDEAREKNARFREIISRANRDYDEQIELFRAEGNKLRDIAERAIENCECEPKCASHYGAHCDCGRTKRSVELRAELDQLKEDAK